MTLSYSRTALILLAATSLSACTTYAPFGEDAQVARPNYPTRLPPPDTQTLPPAQSGPDQAPAPQAPRAPQRPGRSAASACPHPPGRP